MDRNEVDRLDTMETIEEYRREAEIFIPIALKYVDPDVSLSDILLEISQVPGWSIESKVYWAFTLGSLMDGMYSVLEGVR